MAVNRKKSMEKNTAWSQYVTHTFFSMTVRAGLGGSTTMACVLVSVVTLGVNSCSHFWYVLTLLTRVVMIDLVLFISH